MSQEMPGVTRSLERQVRILPSRLWREYDLANTLISGYYPPELSHHKFVLFEATQCFAMAAPGNWHTVQTHIMTYSHTWPGIWHSIFISWHLKQNKTKHTKKRQWLSQSRVMSLPLLLLRITVPSAHCSSTFYIYNFLILRVSLSGSGSKRPHLTSSLDTLTPQPALSWPQGSIDLLHNTYHDLHFFVSLSADFVLIAYLMSAAGEQRPHLSASPHLPPLPSTGLGTKHCPREYLSRQWTHVVIRGSSVSITTETEEYCVFSECWAQTYGRREEEGTLLGRGLITDLLECPLGHLDFIPYENGSHQRFLSSGDPRSPVLKDISQVRAQRMLKTVG